MDQDTIEYLKSLGISVARGVPQLATGFVDLAALPFTLSGLIKPEQAFGSTDWMTAKGYLPPKQEGLLSETTELLSGAINPATGAMAIGATAAKGLSKAAKKAAKTEFELAHEVAQRNAALPISEGGLGLPANNTAMDRAAAMGFDVNNPMFHGTNADILEFSTKGKGKTSGAGAFFSNNPLVSETYLSGSGGGNVLPVLLRNSDLLKTNAKGANWADIETNKLYANKKSLLSMFDELTPNSATSTDELSMLAKEAGFPGITIANVKDIGPNSHIFRAKEYLKDRYGITVDETWSNVSGKQFAEAQKYLKDLYEGQKSNVTAIQEPSRIRSKFAAFDPMKKESGNILAGTAAGGLGISSLLADDSKKELTEDDIKFLINSGLI